MAAAGASTSAVVVAAIVACMVLSTAPASAHNITAILEDFPEYSLYNSYLTKTKVADEINSRETVTCLVLDDGAMSALAAHKPLAAIKNALRLLALLDYFDPPKIHSLPTGSTLTTTLLQTTGNEPGNLGFVNITNLRGGRVGFASAAPGAKFDSTYTKAIKEIPYNLSVLAVSAPIVFDGLFDVPTASSSNLTGLLEKAGCKTFASLLESSGVLKIFQDAMDKGLTLFAPNDEAFTTDGAPDVSALSNAELVTLLEYHALPSYIPKTSLKSVSGRLSTMASSAAGKYDFSVVSHGDDVSLDTGVDSSRIASTILDDTPVCILTLESLLLPVELFGTGPAPAPGPVALTPAPAPASELEAPAPAPKAKSHKRKHPHSPPAPPMASPANSPSDAPTAAADKAEGKTSAGPVLLRGIGIATASTLFVSLVL